MRGEKRIVFETSEARDVVEALCFFYVAYNASELPTGKIPMRTKGVWGSVSLGCKVRGSQGASRAEAERAQARCDRGSDILGRDHAERDRLENTGEEL